MTEIRIDRSDLPKCTRTDEGYVRGEAIVTRTGVFRYLNADGSARLELRHPDNVFSAASLDTLKMIPVTDGHPDSIVNSENARQLAIGQTGETVRIDSSNIILAMNITHADGIASMDSGKKELSLGYTVDLVKEDGVYNGERYTHRQTNIKYNHLALVDRARAGAMARINMDGAAVLTQADPEKNMVKVKLDGLEYEAAPEVAKAMEKETARADAAVAHVQVVKSDMDKLQARMDALQAEHDKLESERTDTAIREAAKARVELVSKAARVVDGDLSALSDREVMEKVITAKHDGVNLDGKSMDYIAARFDALIDSLPAKALEDQRRATGERKDGSVNQDSAEAAKSRADEGIKNLWKGKK
jgi:hypothetical protein